MVFIEELVHFGQAGFVRDGIDVQIKKAVIPSFKFDKLAGRLLFFEFRGELRDFEERDESILGPMQYQHGRNFPVDVAGKTRLFAVTAVFKLIKSVGIFRDINDGAEKNGPVWYRIGKGAVAFVIDFQFRSHRGGRSDIASSGSAEHDDFFRIDVQFLRKVTDKSNRRLPVLKCLYGIGIGVGRFVPVFNEPADCTAFCKIQSLRRKLNQTPTIPSATTKKKKDRTGEALFDIFGDVEMNREFVAGIERLIGKGLGALQKNFLPLRQKFDRSSLHRYSRSSVRIRLRKSSPFRKENSKCQSGTMMIQLPMRFALIVLVASVFLPSESRFLAAQSQTPAQPAPGLRVGLEAAYDAWRGAMSAGDLSRWEQVTAFSRQQEIRNRIVSQKLPFPAALFDDPAQAPTLGGMISLGVLSTGFSATSTYFGKPNFGNASGAAIADNLLVLHFLKEEGSWKFDNLRIVRIGNDGEILLQIRNTDFSFLKGNEFQPASALPPIPQPVNTPELIAEAWVDASGFEVKIYVNNHLTGTFANMKTTELVIGGLRKGTNTVRIESKRLNESPSGLFKVEVGLYAAKDAESPADRVFHYRPGDNPEPSYQQGFTGEVVK